MPVRINLAADRPGGAMDETSPERVAGGTILISAVNPHPGLNGRLHIVKSFPKGLVNQRFDLGILGPGQVHAERLGNRKREIQADPPVRNLFLHRNFGLRHLVHLPHDSSPCGVVPGGEPFM